MNSMLCSRATEECQQESRISLPRVMLGRRMGSALILSNVWNMASTLWMPYCSLISPHFLSGTFSAGGWWWTEKRAPMMTSPSILATERWDVAPARDSFRPGLLERRVISKKIAGKKTQTRIRTMVLRTQSRVSQPSATDATSGSGAQRAGTSVLPLPVRQPWLPSAFTGRSAAPLSFVLAAYSSRSPPPGPPSLGRVVSRGIRVPLFQGCTQAN